MTIYLFGAPHELKLLSELSADGYDGFIFLIPPEKGNAILESLDEIANIRNKFLETLSPPYVLKADGLAAGKGVLIIEKLDEAKKSLKEMLSESKFGVATAPRDKPKKRPGVHKKTQNNKSCLCK